MYRITEHDGSTTYQTVLNDARNSYSMPVLGEADKQSEPIKAHELAADAVGHLFDKLAEIGSDKTLSPLGISQKLEPVKGNTVDTLAQQWDVVGQYDAELAKRDADLTAVPEIDPTHSAMAVREQEIRLIWRTLSPADRNAILEKIQNEPGNEPLLLALLRNPLGALDHEVAIARDVWDKRARMNNPGEAVAIETGRANVEVARRGLVQAAAIAKRGTGWDSQKITNRLLTSQNPAVRRGVGAFGVSAMDAAREARNIAARQGGKAA